MTKMFFGFELIRPVIHEMKALRHNINSAAIRTLLDQAEKLVEQVSNRMVHNHLDVTGVRKMADDANDHLNLAVSAMGNEQTQNQLAKLQRRFSEVCDDYYAYAEVTNASRVRPNPAA